MSTKYYPIHLQRSDGQGYQNDAENSEPVGQKDDRLTRWRAVIGSHLKFQLGDPVDSKYRMSSTRPYTCCFYTNGQLEKVYILANLPDGYELREIKPKSASDKSVVGNVYLFGHPSGTRYRTAGEFVPHVLWLISSSVDRNDCFCTPCMDLVRKEGRQVSTSATPVLQPPVQGAGRGAVQGLPSLRAGNGPAPQQAGQAQQVQQPQQQVQQPQQVQQQQSHQPQQAQQQFQGQVAASNSSDMGVSSLSNIFRVAELVWFKDRAWRLGIVLSISSKTANSPQTPNDSQHIFTLAPLGHAGLRKPNAAKEAAEMRPFLTFSVPDSPKHQGKSFTDIDWIAEAEKARHDPNPAKVQQDLEVLGLEASKVAARTINNCFSFFNKQQDRAQSGSGFSMEFYGGVFLGAEMIVLGDPVRVTPPPKLAGADGDDKPTTVMRVDDIVLLIPHARNHAVDLQFRGTVFHLVRQPEHEIDPRAAGEGSGAAFREEVDFRNSLLDAGERHLHGWWTWKPIEKPAFRNDDHIHGRFYVSHKLMQILIPDQLEEAVRNRVLPQESTLLNTRQQNGGGLPYAGRLLDRRSCLGLSVTVGALNLPAGVREEFQAAGAGARHV